MTQLQIEQRRDTTDRQKLLDEVYAQTTLKVDEAMRASLKTILGTNSDEKLNQILVGLIQTTSMESNGIKMFKISKSNVACDESHPSAEYQNSRVMEMEQFFKFIFAMPSLRQLIVEPQKRFEVTIAFVLTLQTTLFDVQTNVKVQFENGWKTVSRVIMHDILPMELAQKFEFSWYQPPMISQPLEWHEDENGGYLLDQREITKKRGHSRQPEAVCHALNVQQAMVWELNKYCTTEEEIQWNITKNQYKIDKSEKVIYLTAQTMAKQTTSSLARTRDVLQEKNSFHFVWEYDYRGRSYSRGYNYNPQGDKYKKGAINAKSNIH